MKPGFYLRTLEPKSSQRSECTKQAEKVHTNVVWEKADGNCLLQQEMSGDGAIHAKKDRNNAKSVLKITKKIRRAIQNKRRGMLTYGVVFLDDNVGPHTAARNRALPDQWHWELFDHPAYSPDLVPSDYHLFTYLKKWLGSQCFYNNEDLMEGVKTWQSSQAANFFDTN
jgi:transposase